MQMRRRAASALRQYATTTKAKTTRTRATRKKDVAEEAATTATPATSVVSASRFQSAVLDLTRLPYMKYVVGEATMRRFHEKKATTEEKKKVVEALKAYLPRRITQVEALRRARAILDAESVVGPLRGKKAETPAEVLESMKADVMAYWGVEESQFDAAVGRVLKVLEENDINNQTSLGEREMEMEMEMEMERGMGGSSAAFTNPTMSEAQREEVTRIMSRIIG